MNRHINVKTKHMLKYCTSCKYVWESSYCTGNRATRIYKYKELCSYKLKRETCAQCERRLNDKITSKTKVSRVETEYF
jgi:hypothetical protein